MAQEPANSGDDADAAQTGDGLDVLRGIWNATGQTAADVMSDAAAGSGAPSNAKVCRNMKNIGFGGFVEGGGDDGSTAGPVDEDQRAAWRERLEREGKIVPGSGSVLDLITGAEKRP